MSKISKLVEPAAVHSAIAEFDQIGRTAFLKKYGFGKADRYFLRLGNHYYDTKAIAGAAIRYQDPAEAPLSSDSFSGGNGHAVDVLKKMGFVVVDGTPKWLVLAENEVNADPQYNWLDVTGERYHFPNQYRNKIRPGTHFTYYRGGLRLSGKRKTPEYFGTGVVGDVYPDPKTAGLPASKQAWFAEILEYRPYAITVPFKDAAGVYLELGTLEANQPNRWRTAVREIDFREFQNIARLGGLVNDPFERETKIQITAKPELSNEDLMIARVRKTAVETTGDRARRSGARRLSARAKQIGDLGEQIVCDWLRSELTNDSERADIVWVASLGETPGYDIEDRRNRDAPIGYEVKATNGPRFPAIELTENEICKAREMRERFVLVLVASVESKVPKIQFISNPAAKMDEGDFTCTPILFRLEMVTLAPS